VIGGISKLEYTVSVSIYQRLSSKNDYNIFQSMEWRNLSKEQQMAFYKIFTDKDPNLNRESIFSSIKSSIGAFDNLGPSAKSISSDRNKKSMSSEMYRSTVIKAFLEDPRIKEMMKKDGCYLEIPSDGSNNEC
jgi:hypothetical protein